MADFNLGKVSSGGSMCVGGVLGIGSGFPDNLAIVGDAFLKSCTLFPFLLQVMGLTCRVLYLRLLQWRQGRSRFQYQQQVED
jgi:hypothetical protein